MHLRTRALLGWRKEIGAEQWIWVRDFDTRPAPSEWHSTLYVVMRNVWEEAWHLNSLISTLGRYPKQRSKSQSVNPGRNWPLRPPSNQIPIFQLYLLIYLYVLVGSTSVNREQREVYIRFEPYVRWSVSRKRNLWIINSF